MGLPRAAPVSVDLVRVLELLRTHITATLCRTVFATLRTTQRQRRWTLQALVEFWLAVILRAPRALSQALYETLEGSEPLFPQVAATPEAFFQRCQSLRPAFFAEIFTRFTARLLAAVPARYAPEFAALQACFAAVVVVDGSCLAAIAHRLKLLWAERAVVLPGSLLAVYDLGYGLCRVLDFCADAAAGELARAQAALATLPPDTLVLADRLYSTSGWFATLAAQGCWGLVRQDRRLGLRKVRRLVRRQVEGGRLTDWLVEAGGRRAPVQRLRYIRWQRGATVRAVLTNVLDPTRLGAVEALALYPRRWTIERLFFDLKEVLNLHRVYAGNPNAIAMQVYAAGCVTMPCGSPRGKWRRPWGCHPRRFRPRSSSRRWRRRATAPPSSSCGSTTPRQRTGGGRSALHRCSTGASRASHWRPSSSSRAGAGGRTAASVKPDAGGSR